MTISTNIEVLFAIFSLIDNNVKKDASLTGKGSNVTRLFSSHRPGFQTVTGRTTNFVASHFIGSLNDFYYEGPEAQSWSNFYKNGVAIEYIFDKLVAYWKEGEYTSTQEAIEMAGPDGPIENKVKFNKFIQAFISDIKTKNNHIKKAIDSNTDGGCCCGDADGITYISAGSSENDDGKFVPNWRSPSPFCKPKGVKDHIQGMVERGFLGKKSEDIWEGYLDMRSKNLAGGKRKSRKRTRRRRKRKKYSKKSNRKLKKKSRKRKRKKRTRRRKR